MMQTAERRKRQNCGNSFPMVFGGTGQMGLGSNLTMAAEGNVSHCYGPMFAGVQGGMPQGNRLHTRNFQSGGSEAGSSNFPGFSLNDERFATKTCWNAVLPGSEEGTSQYSTSNPVGNFANNFHPTNESRNSYKRKSSMDSSAGLLTSRALSGQRESDFIGFTQISGTRRLDTSMIPGYDESQLTRDSHNAFQCSRTSALHHSQNEVANRYDGVITPRTRESYHSPSIIGGLPSQASMPRRPTTMIGSAGNMGIGLPEILSFRQGSGLSATGTWCANNTFVEGGNNQSGFVNDGNQPRHNLSQALDMIGISSVDSRLPQPPSRISRSVHLREFNSQASHASQHTTPNPYVYGGTVDLQAPATSAAQPLSRFNNVHPQGGMLRFPPPGSAAALNSMMSGPRATYGDAHPSFATVPGPAMTSLLPRYNDTNQASYALRGQRALPSQGMNPHRFAASHELLDQSLVHIGGDWADIHDQHSDMRLDVDNMSYEELLALEERIGNVNTGLSEDDVDKSLKTSIYSCSDATSGGNSQENDLKCSICQEEYVEGDELGQLDCGHGYHTACIKQWLLLKNQCPICKARACSKA